MGPMSVGYVVDTNILILLVAGRLHDPLPVCRLGVSIITEIEMLSYGRLTLQDEQHIRSMLATMERLAMTEDVKEQTIMLRRHHNIKLPDAIICATAMINQAVLLTNDKQLANIPELRTRSFSLKSADRF